jgi:hypothetical protein
MGMRYFFRCKGCKREKEVGESTFKRFIGDKWNEFLAAAEKENATGAMIKFKTKCPFCSREGKEDVEIVLLRGGEYSSTA